VRAAASLAMVAARGRRDGLSNSRILFIMRCGYNSSVAAGANREGDY
jgi:hypothetical protein